MLRFRLGPIPVEVHPSHFLMAIAFGSLGLSDRDPSVWPGRALVSHDALTHASAVVGVVAIWVAIVFVSVLVHELGHALVSLAYHYQPSIQLVGLGGLTRPNAPGPIPWHREVVLTAAGPLMGAALGGLCLLLRSSVGTWEVARYTLTLAALANFFWAVVNLLPVLPLDGGRISQAVLGRLFGKAGLVGAQLLALLVCVAVIFWRWGDFFLTLFFLLFALQAVRALSALLRGEGPPADSAELQRLEALFRSGDLKAARESAEALAAQDTSPPVRSRAHHLLGWIALKEGEGRRALDHFSQVQGRGVEKQALAAAFSLVGDDARALPLWQQAYESSRTPPSCTSGPERCCGQARWSRPRGCPAWTWGRPMPAPSGWPFCAEASPEPPSFGARRPQTLLGRAAYDVACALARAGELGPWRCSSWSVPGTSASATRSTRRR